MNLSLFHIFEFGLLNYFFWTWQPCLKGSVDGDKLLLTIRIWKPDYISSKEISNQIKVLNKPKITCCNFLKDPYLTARVQFFLQSYVTTIWYLCQSWFKRSPSRSTNNGNARLLRLGCKYFLPRTALRDGVLLTFGY